MKILVVGDPETGKTSYIKRLVQDTFNSKYKGSKGVDFYLREVFVDGETVRLQLWDVANVENTIGNISKSYYRDAFGAMIIYDVTRPSTFDTVVDWKKEIDSKVGKLPNGEPLPVLLVGNKHDLETAQADGHQLDKFCNDYGFTSWFDVSAKSGYNVVDAASYLAQRVLEEDDIFDQAHREAVEYRRNQAFEPKSTSWFY